MANKAICSSLPYVCAPIIIESDAFCVVALLPLFAFDELEETHSDCGDVPLREYPRSGSCG